MSVTTDSSNNDNAFQRFFRAKRGHSPFNRMLIHLALIISSIIAIYPVLRVLSVSLRPGDRLLSTSLAIIPSDATLNNYFVVITEKDFMLWLWNSLAITVSTAIIGVIFSSTSAYAFSRWRFPGRNTGMLFLLATQMIPAAMLMVPIYILAVKLGLLGTYRGLVIAYSVSSIPFSVWILKGYYDTIPRDLEEAALIDGANRITAFYRIILPLSTPALSVVFLFNFMQAWNDYLLARVLLANATEIWTWPLGLQALQGQFQTAWGQFAAASIMVMIPVVALFLYSSKYLISGLTAGGVKG
ncbi:sugar ABC transporter permease [Anaerolineales bacterium HSG6]|nr:sugar ABC transporter permease [Anaerolineales bacterium HSG6]MDM8531348.1 sugar ABC transporter permease [Anaerolineales bacterium HSG25]